MLVLFFISRRSSASSVASRNTCPAQGDPPARGTDQPAGARRRPRSSWKKKSSSAPMASRGIDALGSTASSASGSASSPSSASCSRASRSRRRTTSWPDSEGPRRIPMSALFATTLFFSSALLFVVEPLVGKSLLPLLGGGAPVWTTTVAFFQIALLAGYLYAHALAGRPKRWLAGAHVIALVVAALWFGQAARPTESLVASAHPALWLFGTLALSVGVPFVFVAASTPAAARVAFGDGARRRARPLLLYAASNAGSLLALLAYPTLVEPSFGLARQRQPGPSRSSSWRRSSRHARPPPRVAHARTRRPRRGASWLHGRCGCAGSRSRPCRRASCCP